MYTESSHLLTDTEIANTKPAHSNLKLYDQNGLYLLVKTTGKKLWRLKYEYNGIERSVTFGTYPQICLKHARVVCQQHHQDLERGIDPSINIKSIKNAQAAKLL